MTSPTVQAPAPACSSASSSSECFSGATASEQAAGGLRVEEREHQRVLLGDGAGEPAGGFAAGSFAGRDELRGAGRADLVQARQQEVAVVAQPARVHVPRDEVEDAVVQGQRARGARRRATPLASSISPRWPARPNPLTSVQACTPMRAMAAAAAR